MKILQMGELIKAYNVLTHFHQEAHSIVQNNLCSNLSPITLVQKRSGMSLSPSEYSIFLQSVSDFSNACYEMCLDVTDRMAEGLHEELLSAKVDNGDTVLTGKKLSNIETHLKLIL